MIEKKNVLIDFHRKLVFVAHCVAHRSIDSIPFSGSLASCVLPYRARAKRKIPAQANCVSSVAATHTRVIARLLRRNCD